MKKSKLARKLQEAKRRKRRVLKENYSPNVDEDKKEGTPDLDALLTESSENGAKYIVVSIWDDSEGVSDFDVAGPHDRDYNIKPVSREEAFDFMIGLNKKGVLKNAPNNEKFEVWPISNYNTRVRSQEDFEEDWLIPLTESKKARGRFPKKKRAIRGKRKLTEGSLPKKDSLAVVWMWKDSNGTMNHDMYHALNDNAAAQEVKDIKSNRCYDKTKDIIKIMPLAKYENKFNDDNDIITESKKKDINFGMSQNLVESINSFLTEDEDEETFFSNPDQEDAFGKSGRDDKPRSGKEFQEMTEDEALAELVYAARTNLSDDGEDVSEKVKKMIRSFVDDEIEASLDDGSVILDQFAPRSVNIDDQEKLVGIIVEWLTNDIDFLAGSLLPTSFGIDSSSVEDIIKATKKIQSGNFSSIYDISGNFPVATLEYIPKTEALEKAFPELKQMNIDVQTPPQDRPTSNTETRKFLQVTQRFERVLARMNGIGVDSNGALNVDLSDYDISGFSEAIETASDSLSDLLDYLDI